jgi:preprotein translocase subunit SecA
VNAVEEQRRSEKVQNMQFLHTEEADEPEQSYHDRAVTTFKRDEKKMGRNDPCFCGSGKKYKTCHGSLT